MMRLVFRGDEMERKVVCADWDATEVWGGAVCTGRGRSFTVITSMDTQLKSTNLISSWPNHNRRAATSITNTLK